MKIICYRHQEYQSIADILRLYFQEIQIDEENNGIRIEDNSDLNEDCIIVSEASVAVSKTQIRDQKDQTEIEVKTFVKERDLYISSRIFPNALRREIKRQMYFILSSLLNMTYPWGSLTGIRPTQIALRSYLENDHDLIKAEKNLTDYWFVSKEKAKIALETAISEEKTLQKTDPNLQMLYIGIPFCRTRCAYCSFITRDATAQAGFMDLYTDALIEELKQISDYMAKKNKKFQALYVGGGTPTALSDESFLKLMTTIKNEVPLIKNAELTVEAGRPDSISQSKLESIKTLGEVRICINPQTMHDRTLKLIGRDHSVADVYEAMAKARKLNFDAINMDLILGLPKENKEDFLFSLDKVLELKPESITVHTMALKRSAFIEQKYNQKYMALRFPNQELSEAFSQSVNILKENNYQPYYLYRQKNVRAGLENIGFAKKGHACVYNVGMMSDRISVIGLGSGSATKIISGDLVERLYNPKDILTFSQRISEISQKKIAFMSERDI